MSDLEHLIERLDSLIASGRPFTADDVTDNGRLTVSGDHAPNQKQNTIGTLFRTAAAADRIGPTGRVVKSRAPHRKGGMIREWEGSDHEQ